MRHINYSALGILMLSIGIWGCKPKINYKMKISLTRLSKENIYNKELVGDAIFDAQELQIDSLDRKSNKLFLKGVDLYKNKKDPAAAIDAFKQSLLVFPRVETYYEIGSALMDMQADKNGEDKKAVLREALQAYQVAEYLHYQPIYSVYYNMACASNLLGYDDSTKTVDKISLHLNEAVSNLRNAFANGFSDTAMLQKDSRLSSILKTDEYRQLINELNADKKPDTTTTLYSLYKAEFPLLTQPFTIPVDSLDMKGYKTNISFEYARFIPEMENTSFGRDVSHDYYVVGKLTETPLYTAIIYTSTEFDGVEPSTEPVYIKLVTYTPEGNIIDNRIISCRCSTEKAKTVRIENNTITTEEFKLTWKYPLHVFQPQGEGDEDSIKNMVTKSESLGKTVYKLSDIGKIVPLDSDSTKVTFN